MEKINKVYRQLNMNPDPSIFEKSLCSYAVSSTAAALDIPWEEAVRALYSQAHDLCLMPQNRKCINGMMSSLGFYQQPGIYRYYYPVSQLCADFPEKYGEDAVAVVLGDNENVCAHAFAIKPGEDGRFYAYYPMKGTELLDLERHASCIWVRWPDGQDHSPKKRRSGGRKAGPKPEYEPTKDNEHFHYVNRNPANNNEGDCVVRGVASALDISWHEALDELVRAADYKYPVVNQNMVYTKLLEDKGYFCMHPVRKGGIRAWELCEQMDELCSHGERAFVDFRKAHAAAIVPVYEGDGYRYKVEDTWDSSDNLISEVWIGRPPYDEY